MRLYQEPEEFAAQMEACAKSRTVKIINGWRRSGFSRPSDADLDYLESISATYQLQIERGAILQLKFEPTPGTSEESKLASKFIKLLSEAHRIIKQGVKPIDECVVCGTAFPHAASTKNKRIYCSTVCRNRAARESARAAKVTKRKSSKKRKVKRAKRS